jgi:hypothetical protein
MYPVPVHASEVRLLQPFARQQLSIPDGTTGELSPAPSDSDADLADGPATLWPLLVYVAVGGVLGPLLWYWGHTETATWARFLLQLGAALFVVLAVWCGAWLLVFVPLSVIAKRYRSSD